MSCSCTPLRGREVRDTRGEPVTDIGGGWKVFPYALARPVYQDGGGVSMKFHRVLFNVKVCLNTVLKNLEEPSFSLPKN